MKEGTLGGVFSIHSAANYQNIQGGLWRHRKKSEKRGILIVSKEVEKVDLSA